MRSKFRALPHNNSYPVGIEDDARGRLRSWGENGLHKGNLCSAVAIHRFTFGYQMLSRFRHPAFSRRYLPVWIGWIVLVLLFTAGIFFFPSSGTNMRLLISFVYVFALLLLPPIIICWYARRKAKQERRQMGTASPSEFRGEWLKWQKSNTYVTSVDEGSCAICLSDFLPGQQVRNLPCKHMFHVRCFDGCFVSTLPPPGRCHKCPLCRRDLGPLLVSPEESGAISVV